MYITGLLALANGDILTELSISRTKSLGSENPLSREPVEPFGLSLNQTVDTTMGRGGVAVPL